MTNQIVLAMIKSTSRTIRGVRLIVIISTTASIVTFISAYNTWENGWYTIRNQQYKVMAEWCSNGNSYDLCDYKLKEDEKDDKFKERLINWLDKNDAQGKKNCEQKCHNIQILSEHVMKRRLNAIFTVNIPWLGVHFDINDLGIFSGLFLIILALMLSYTLGLKYSNLDKLFTYIDQYCEKENKLKYYELTTFSQILKLPKGKTQEISPLVLRLIPYVLFALPFIVHIYVFGYDLATKYKVDGVGSDITPVILFTGLFSVILLWFAISSIRIDRSTDVLWEAYEDKFKEEHTNNKEISKE